MILDKYMYDITLRIIFKFGDFGRRHFKSSKIAFPIIFRRDCTIQVPLNPSHMQKLTSSESVSNFIYRIFKIFLIDVILSTSEIFGRQFLNMSNLVEMYSLPKEKRGTVIPTLCFLFYYTEIINMKLKIFKK